MTKTKTAKKAAASKKKKAIVAKAVKPVLTAKQFIERLKKHQSDAELKKMQSYFKTGEGEYGAVDQFMGLTWV